MSGTGSRAWVEADLGALVDNARTVARTAGARLLPIVKANAYGVGAVAVSKALEQLDPWGYGVATIEEGAELRAAGIARPILVFMPPRAQLFDQYDRHHLTPALGDAGSILEWTTRGERAFHLEIDTGMGRSGVRWDEVEARASLADATLSLYRDPIHGRGVLRLAPREARFLRLDPRLPCRAGLLWVSP